MVSSFVRTRTRLRGEAGTHIILQGPLRCRNRCGFSFAARLDRFVRNPRLSDGDVPAYLLRGAAKRGV